MTQTNKRITGGRLTSLLVLLMALTACEKKIDNTIPPEASSFSLDAEKAFSTLSGNESLWYWDLTTPLAQGQLMVTFKKDSSAALFLLQRYSLVNQLLLLANNGDLSDEEFDDVAFLYNTFRSYDDATVRSLLDNPANAYFKNLTQVYLPNYINFNGYYQYGLVENPTYVVNGPVQLSLTFNNSTFLPSLKQSRQLDYDFRILSYSKDGISLNGYYNTSSNKACKLLPMSNAEAVPGYADASYLLMSCIFTRTNASLKLDGTTVTVPPTYRSGLDYFYQKNKDGVLNKQLMEFSYVVMNTADADIPEALKDLRFFTVTSSYDGEVLDAPVGTTLVTLAAHTATGAKKVLEFVKE